METIYLLNLTDESKEIVYVVTHDKYLIEALDREYSKDPEPVLRYDGEYMLDYPEAICKVMGMIERNEETLVVNQFLDVSKSAAPGE